jgi:hypothetical protein
VNGNVGLDKGGSSVLAAFVLRVHSQVSHMFGQQRDIDQERPP